MKPEDLVAGEAYFVIRYERMESPIPVVVSYEYVGLHEFLDEDSQYCCSYLFNYLPAFRRDFQKGEVLQGFADGDIPHALRESDLDELRSRHEALTELTSALAVEESQQSIRTLPVDEFLGAEIDFMRRVINKELDRSRRKLSILDAESADAVSINTSAIVLSRILEKIIASERRIR